MAYALGSSSTAAGRFSKSEVNQLLDKAEAHVCYNGSKVLCKYLYRNKPKIYFNRIFSSEDGIMRPYLKDNSGDPKSPINGFIDGLFFFASVEHGSHYGQPISDSPFGSERFLTPVEELVDWSQDHLYFADFFCMTGKRHYVTLVLCKPGSSSDQFCRSRLPELSLSHNDFFCFDSIRNTFVVNDTFSFFVEIFYTEEIDILSMVHIKGKATMKTVPTACKGSSTPGGLKKNPSCSTCNLGVRSSTSAARYLRSYNHLLEDFEDFGFW